MYQNTPTLRPLRWSFLPQRLISLAAGCGFISCQFDCKFGRLSDAVCSSGFISSSSACSSSNASGKQRRPFPLHQYPTRYGTKYDNMPGCAGVVRIRAKRIAASLSLYSFVWKVYHPVEESSARVHQTYLSSVHDATEHC